MYTTQNKRCDKAEKLNKYEPITEENVRKRGEWMAVRVFRYKIGLDGSGFYRKLYYGLVKDLSKFDDPGYALTESYDTAQEAIMFLCGYMGRSMKDLITYRGEEIPIIQACFRFLNAYLSRVQRRVNNVVQPDDLPKHELTVAFDWDPDEMDYANVYEKIKLMNLSEHQTEVLDCRMRSATATEAARMLSVTRNSVRGSLKYIKLRYLKVFQDRSDCIVER